MARGDAGEHRGRRHAALVAKPISVRARVAAGCSRRRRRADRPRAARRRAEHGRRCRGGSDDIGDVSWVVPTAIAVVSVERAGHDRPPLVERHGDGDSDRAQRRDGRREGHRGDAARSLARRRAARRRAALLPRRAAKRHHVRAVHRRRRRAADREEHRDHGRVQDRLRAAAITTRDASTPTSSSSASTTRSSKKKPQQLNDVRRKPGSKSWSGQRPIGQVIPV